MYGVLGLFEARFDCSQLLVSQYVNHGRQYWESAR